MRTPRRSGSEHRSTPEYVASILDDVATQDAVFTADTGMCNVWSARYLNPNGRRRFLSSALHGSMANALPHAIGAQIAEPDRQVVSVSGDGGLSMLLGELITVAMHRLPIKIVLFDNATLGMVKLEMLVDGLADFGGVDVPAVDYARLAETLGFFARRSRIRRPSNAPCATPSLTRAPRARRRGDRSAGVVVAADHHGRTGQGVRAGDVEDRHERWGGGGRADGEVQSSEPAAAVPVRLLTSPASRTGAGDQSSPVIFSATLFAWSLIFSTPFFTADDA